MSASGNQNSKKLLNMSRNLLPVDSKQYLRFGSMKSFNSDEMVFSSDQDNLTD